MRLQSCTERRTSCKRLRPLLGPIRWTGSTTLSKAAWGAGCDGEQSAGLPPSEGSARFVERVKLEVVLPGERGTAAVVFAKAQWT